MTNFPGVRQPALGIQDAVMLPAQTVGNLLMQRLAAAEAAFVPATTTTFDSTTSSTALNGTAGTGNGSLRNLMIPVDTRNFVPIVPNPSPAFGNTQYTQFGNQQLIEAILASQTRPGSMAGAAVFGAGGVELPGIGSGSCGCQCVRELSEEVVIDEENTNGIEDVVAAELTITAPPQTVTVVVPQAQAVPVTPAATAPEATATIQYVTQTV